MYRFIQRNHGRWPWRIISCLVVLSFVSTIIFPPQYSFAQSIMPAGANLPALGSMVHLSSGITPTLVKGITLYPENPFLFDFIVDKGDQDITEYDLRLQVEKMSKYFLASLTVPEEDLWVNLSPYEQNRMIPKGFGQTEMGRDLLIQDYMLKQLAASLTYPEDELGQTFWSHIRTKTQQLFKTDKIPLNVFNKIWIVPDKAVVEEYQNSAFVTESHLKVMIEDDYLALQKSLQPDQNGQFPLPDTSQEAMSDTTLSLIKDILIPEIEKEVNEGSTFASLRQIYHTLILATWFKNKVLNNRDNQYPKILGQVYIDRNKTKGIDVKDKTQNQKIYDRYCESFIKGVYDYIKEDVDEQTQDVIPRKYFSGGLGLQLSPVMTVKTASPQTRPDDIYPNGSMKYAVKLVDYAMLSKMQENDLLLNGWSSRNGFIYYDELRNPLIQSQPGLFGFVAGRRDMENWHPEHLKTLRRDGHFFRHILREFDGMESQAWEKAKGEIQRIQALDVPSEEKDRLLFEYVDRLIVELEDYNVKHAEKSDDTLKLSAESEKQSLAGPWQAQYRTVDSDFQKGPIRSTRMTLPLNWELADGIDNYDGTMQFSRDMVIPAEVQGKRQILRFEGVDYFANVWVNGHFVGSHAGDFAPFEFDVSGYVNYGGLNRVRVTVTSPRERQSDEADSFNNFDHPFPNRKTLPKGTKGGHDQFFGGAWGPHAQDGNTGGIWGDVFLLSKPDVRILTDKFKFTTLSLKEGEDEATDANVQMNVVFENAGESRQGTLKVTMEPANFEGESYTFEEPATFEPGVHRVDIGRTLKDVGVWEVWDQLEPGQEGPRLYNISVEVITGDGTTDVMELQTGIRTVGVSDTGQPTGPIGKWVINGETMFVRGLNYLPTYWVSEYSEKDYLKHLRLLKDAGLNTLYVHALVLPSAFYRAADKEGFMVIQMSPLQWSYDIKNETFVRRAKEMTNDLVDFVYNFPSVVGYVAHNEPDMRVEDRNKDNRKFSRQLHQIIRRRDPNRMAEAYSLVSGNHAYPSQFYPYTDDTSYSTLPGTGEQENRPHFPNLIAEFGIQAMANDDIFRETLSYKRVLKVLEWMRKNPAVSQNTRGEPWSITRHHLYEVLQILGGLQNEDIGNTFKEGYAWVVALKAFDWHLLMDISELYEKREANNAALRNNENRPHRFTVQEEMALIILDMLEYAALKRESIYFGNWNRASSLEEFVDITQRRQYRLHKDAVETYRAAELFGRTAGFVGFAAVDPAPNAHTWGVIAKGGVPKKAYSAYVESAQPVAVTLGKALLRPVKVANEAWFGADTQEDESDVSYPLDRPWVSSEILIHNNTPRSFDGAKVTIWVEDTKGNRVKIINPKGNTRYEYSFEVDIPAQRGVNYFLDNPGARQKNPPSQWLVPEETEAGTYYLKAQITDSTGKDVSTNRYEFIVLEAKPEFIQLASPSTTLKIVDAITSLKRSLGAGEGEVIQKALSQFNDIDGAKAIVRNLETISSEVLSPAEKDRVLSRYLARLQEYVHDVQDQRPPDAAMLASPVKEEIREQYGEFQSTKTHLTTELLAALAYQQYLAQDDRTPETWAEILLEYVRNHKYPKNYQDAGAAALKTIQSAAFKADAYDNQVIKLFLLSQRFGIRREWILNFLQPGLGDPWSVRAAWSLDLLEKHLRALVLSFDGDLGHNFSAADARASITSPSMERFIDVLAQRATEGSDIQKTIRLAGDLLRYFNSIGRDVLVEEPHRFAQKLIERGVPGSMRDKEKLVRLRNAIILIGSINLMKEADDFLQGAETTLDAQPDRARAGAAMQDLTRALARYKRLSVAHSFPEYLIERHQSIHRMLAAAAKKYGFEGQGKAHLVLTPTKERPWELQRELLSIYNELQLYGYGNTVHIIIKEDSKKEADKVQNARIVEQFRKLGLSITYWESDDLDEFIDRLNAEIFPDGDFDIRRVAGTTPAGSKGIHYGLFRNLLLLLAMQKVTDEGISEPIMTWVDDDNQAGAYVLTGDLRTDQRHVFNYFGQKDTIFSNPNVWIGGGGYTKDGIEGVEGFGNAWGWMHKIFDEATSRSPEESARFPEVVDVTQYRPWDQHQSLPLLLSEGEQTVTYRDQFLTHLRVLSGSFVGKYANQTQIFHPWVDNTPNVAESGDMLQTSRAFDSMPGGNTSFRKEAFFSGIPFFTGPGRGEDLYFNWLVQRKHGNPQGRSLIYLTHTPLVHTRSVAGRHDIIGEIVSSYNGRIVRESQVLWKTVNEALGNEYPTPWEVAEAETIAHIGNMKNEARGTILGVISYAKAVINYLYDKKYWWVKLAETDPEYEQELRLLRERVKRLLAYEEGLDEFLDEKLLTFEDVKREAKEFGDIFPYWSRIVEHFRAAQAAARVTAPDSTAPLEKPDQAGYMRGSPAAGDKPSTTVDYLPGKTATIADKDIKINPVDNQLSMLMSIYRKWEYGQANANALLTLHSRSVQLNKIYDEYLTENAKSPVLWLRFVQEALFVPYSEGYNALAKIAAGVDENQGALSKLGLANIRRQHTVDDDILTLVLGSPFAPQIISDSPPAGPSKAEQGNKAMLADDVGGINLNPGLFNLEVKESNYNPIIPVAPALDNSLISIEGFIPVIINIQPLPASVLYPLMGYKKDKEPFRAADNELPHRDLISLWREKYYLKSDSQRLPAKHKPVLC